MSDNPKIPAILLMKAALPLTKVLVEEKPEIAWIYKKWNKAIQFRVEGDEDLCCHIAFVDGVISFSEKKHPAPDIEFLFKDSASFVALMTGKPALPKIKGLLRNFPTLLGFLPLMLGLTLLMPNKLPKDPKGRALKIKLLLYFISVALSKLNKAGDEEMRKFTKNMPDRIFQWSVEQGGPAVYLRIKHGRTKAGKGLYTRRKPFVHMRFSSIDSAFEVLTGQIDNVVAMKEGKLVVEGSPEHGKDISGIMKNIEKMIS